MKKGYEALRRFKELINEDNIEFQRRIEVYDSNGNHIKSGIYGVMIILDPHNGDYSKINKINIE